MEQLDDEIVDARLALIDMIRGVMLYHAAIDEIEDEQQQAEIVETVGDLADLLLEALNLEIVAVDGNFITARLELEPID